MHLFLRVLQILQQSDFKQNHKCNTISYILQNALIYQHTIFRRLLSTNIENIKFFPCNNFLKVEQRELS